MQQMRR